MLAVSPRPLEVTMADDGPPPGDASVPASLDTSRTTPSEGVGVPSHSKALAAMFPPASRQGEDGTSAGVKRSSNDVASLDDAAVDNNDGPNKKPRFHPQESEGGGLSSPPRASFPATDAPAIGSLAPNVLQALLSGQDLNINRFANESAARRANDAALRLRTQLSSQLLQEQLARSRLMTMGAGSSSSFADPLALQALLQSSNTLLGSSGPSLAQQRLASNLLGQQEDHNLLRQLVGLQSVQQSHQNLTLAAANSLLRQGPMRTTPAFDLALLLQQQQQRQQQQLLQQQQRQQQQLSSLSNGTAVLQQASLANLIRQSSVEASSPAQAADLPKQVDETKASLPRCEEGAIEPYYKRQCFSLGIDEDPNWLSEFHCFVRSELVEVFRASQEDVRGRNNSIAHLQVGLRCKYCAHQTPGARAGRSSAFPSSLRQIYQSFTMMLRDHFASCDSIPRNVKDKFVALKDKPTQGATDSKRFWIYAATKIGMADSSDGIAITEATRASGGASLPFGTVPGQPWTDESYASVALVVPADRPLISEFLYTLMSQVQLIRLKEAERIGNRRSLRVGLAGLGCRHCCKNRRLGLCRVFPARRRTLPSKIKDMYDHLRRCSLCPDTVKEELERSKNPSKLADQGDDKEFFDRIWNRLGHGPASSA